MTNETAKHILELLLDGVDPRTGEFLPKDHVFNTPAVIRALHMAILALSAPAKPMQEPVSPPPLPAAKPSDPLNASRAWTDDELDALKRLYLANISLETICSMLQRRERGVKRQLAYLGLIESEKASGREPTPGRERVGFPWLQQEDELLKEMHRRRRPIHEIADELHRTPYAVYLRMERNELYGSVPGYPEFDELPKWTAADTKELRRLFEEGKTVEELAMHFGRTEKSISARLFYMGLSKESPLPPLLKKR